MATINPPIPRLEPIAEEQTKGVGVGEVARMALRSLTVNKTRSLLTMLGVIIGVASVIALLAIGNGASGAIISQVSSNGTNQLTIQPGSPSTQGPVETSAPQTLTLADTQAIQALKLPVQGVAPQFSSNASLVAVAANTNVTVAGVTADYQIVNNLTLASGTFIGASDVQGGNLVVVLGTTVAHDLFGNGQAVGQRVRVGGQSLRVIGVLQSKGGAFGSPDTQAFVPISVAQQRLFDARTPDGNDFQVNSISLSATNSADLESIQARITTLLRERHERSSDGSEDDFRFFNQASLLSSLSTITTLLTVFLAAVAGISLLVGGIGIMNIMLVSVTERTREIGLRKAVGARERDILLQFVAEALGLSLVGGVIGLAIGAGVAFAVTLSGLLTTTVSWSSVALALGFSLAVGLFFGIYPASRAAKLNPIDALRYE